MEDFSIDQKKLPGVKEVCRDFAVLEDHCLAHNLQEQEIESHLASNVHKSRLVQQDLQVAKRLQEEEDQRAKAQSHRQNKDIERIDTVVAQEIQEQLVRQAERQRQQEEKDEAIARKLQEREMKEERKRQKQMEANLEEEYFEERGARRPPSDPRERFPRSDSPPSERRERHHSQDERSPDPVRKRPPEHRRRDPEHEPGASPPWNTQEEAAGRREDSPSEGWQTEERRVEENALAHGRRADWSPEYLEVPEPVVRRKERPVGGDAQDREIERHRERRRDAERERERDWERDRRPHGDRTVERSRERVLSRDAERDERHRLLDVDRAADRHAHTHAHTHTHRHRGHERDVDTYRGSHKTEERHTHTHSHARRQRSRERGLEEERGGVFEEQGSRSRGERREPKAHREEHRGRAGSDEPRSPRDRAPPAGRLPRSDAAVREATHSLVHMDLQDQELRDLEVARKFQEEELKATQVDRRAAQVAQDEEIARRLMEEEKKEYKRAREKEKQAMDRKRSEADWKHAQEEAVRPRSRDELEYQRGRNPKPSRPPPARVHDYENVEAGYPYTETPCPTRPTSRPQAAYKGSYYRQ